MTRLNLAEIERRLCKAISEACEPGQGDRPLLRFIDQVGEDAAWEISRLHEVEGLLGHGLEPETGAKLSHPWLEAHRQTRQRITLYLHELDGVAAALSREGIPLVALKNGGIARGLHPCAGCSPMGDVDLLVAKGNFRAAHRLLLDLGYRFEFRSPLEEASLDAAERGGGAEYWKLLPGGEKLWLELQWRPVSGRWLRPDQEPSAEELMGRSVAIEGTEVRLLAPEDNLLQVCLHTAKHSYVRAPGFRLHLDVERIVRYQSIDWGLFVGRVAGLQVCTPVYFSLLLSARLLGTPVPASVLSRLEPGFWKRRLLTGMLNAAGLFNPAERKFSRLAYILFNALLYDDMMGFLRGIFPASDWMKEQYGFSSSLLLPYYHGRRLCNLLFRRLKT